MTTQIHYDWAKLADHVVRGHEITPIEALAILNSEDQELLYRYASCISNPPRVLWEQG